MTKSDLPHGAINFGRLPTSSDERKDQQAPASSHLGLARFPQPRRVCHTFRIELTTLKTLPEPEPKLNSAHVVVASVVVSVRAFLAVMFA